MFSLIFTDEYKKIEKRFLKKHPDLKDKYKKSLIFLASNPFHPSLRIHKLKGGLKEYYSVSINMSYRIVINLIIRDNKIILLNIGDHGDVY